MKMFTLPNLITSGNLLFGLAGIIFLFQQDFRQASFCILIALILDFLDGFVARLTGSFSEIGKQLDSLADMVTFGALPALMLYFSSGIEGYLNIICLLPALFSALRLAKFNIDERQSVGFYGLPTPANAMTIASFPFIFSAGAPSFLLTYQGEFYLIYSVAISLLMISEIPMMALKFKNFTWAANKLKYTFLILSAVLLLVLQIQAVPLILLWYILVSVFASRKSS